MQERLLLCLILCMTSRFVTGQDTSTSENADHQTDKILFGGYVRGSAYFGGSTYDFADLISELKLNADAKFGKASMKTDIRVRTGMTFDEKKNEIEVKELFGSFQTGPVKLSVGNQIVEWGRADGYNPTNNLTPKNYFFLSSDMDDQLLSNFMTRLKIAMGANIDADLVLVPFYRPSAYRYDLIPIGQNIQFLPFEHPGFEFKNMGFAGRLNFDFPDIGFSFSYFNGYSHFYGFDNEEITFDPAGSLAIINLPKPYRKQAPGLDFAIPTALVIIRGETAYNLVQEEKGIFVPKNDLSYVIGLEKELGGFHFIFQYLGKFIPDFETYEAPDPMNYDLTNPLDQLRFGRDMAEFEMGLFNRKIFGQQNEFGHAISGFVSKSFAFDEVTTELAGMYDFRTEEWMIRPKVVWKPLDQVSIGLGGTYLKGPEKSLFDYSEGIMTGFFADFRVYF